MAKAGTPDNTLMAASGKWVWKEETSCLEFLGNVSSVDRPDKRKGHRQKAALHLQDNTSKHKERGATPSLGSRVLALGIGRTSRMGHKSPKPGKDHTHVSLDDVKSIAIAMLSEVNMIAPKFEGIYTTEQFDKFLMCLLNFFDTFFEKRLKEHKPNPMNIKPSAAEQKGHADLCGKLARVQHQLGEAYCTLVMGIGMADHHHMACGTSRVSSTYKDRSMYETLYSFCTFVVWITFRRPEYDIINKEVSRMFRSDTFNPAIRIKYAEKEPIDDDDSNDEKKEREPEKKLTKAEYRRLHGKRPGIKSIINQRSPALGSILPHPKEKADYLFKRGGVMDASNLVDNDEDIVIEPIPDDVDTFKVGIIGEPLDQFNHMTLTPLAAENEGEDGEKEAVDRGGSVLTSSHESGLMRETTAFSRATTDTMSDEDE